MKVALRIFSIILIAVILTMSISAICFAKDDTKNILGKIDDGVNSANVDATGAAGIAGKVIRMIRVAAVIVGAVLIAVFGIKFMLGSAEEKAEYKKSFIPLIIGIIVVFGSTYLASLLFNTFSIGG